nr:MAG TPA: hypothetical protein [Caudoviricetes sp.]
MATKLKNMVLTSVDLVRAGANQEADICLFKSAEEQPREEGIFKRFLRWLRENPAAENFVEKATFDQIHESRENSERLWRYTDALSCSFRSILEDESLDDTARAQQMRTSLRQFDAAMDVLIGDLTGQERAPQLEQIREI